MAEIKNYQKEKEKRQKKQPDFQQRIRRHRLNGLYRVLAVLGVIALILLIVWLQYTRHVYTDFDVLSSDTHVKSEDTRDLRLGEAVLSYGKDGAHCTNAKGTVTWNQTYEIQDIKLATCGNAVAIADYNGRSIYVQNADKVLGTVNTSMPIKNLTVSAGGEVTAVLEDSDTTRIETYAPDGRQLYTGQTHMQNSGYPAAVSLSPNGDLLAVSYIYVDAGVLKTNIAFYNFGPVGANQSDHLVGAHSYVDLVVPEIHFMNDSVAFAVADSRLMFYEGSQKPVSISEHLYDREIRSVFYSDKYVGLVFSSDAADYRYMMKVYGTNGSLVDTFYFDLDYRDIVFTEKNFIIYNEEVVSIMTYGGVEKFNGSLDRPIRLIVPTQSAFRYLVVTDESIDTVQLK